MPWVNASLLGLLVLGHTVFWVSLVNRVHSLPWRRQILRHVRHLHDILLLLFPVAVIWFVGLHGPRLLRGGSWNSLPPFWVGVFTICAASLVWLLWVIVRRRLISSPLQLVRTSSIVHDIAGELGRLPVAPGPYYAFTRFPGNEQFRLEVTEKHLQLSRLPAAWDGLSILHLSDFHFLGTIAAEYYIQVLEIVAREQVDLICFTGDLIDNPACIDWLRGTLGRLTAPLGRYFILGNHDWYQGPQQIREAFIATGWLDLGSHTEQLSCRGSQLEIGGDETPWMGHHPQFSTTENFRLLLSHTPDNIRWARRQHVDLMLAGHNHGGQIQLPGIGPVYSPSWYGCRYAAGTFWEPPTLLHVSRGLAGQHPVRWHCLPEITRLVLHPENSDLVDRH